ncbi:hypothetical protein Y032_0006g3135 [Ancylostoma ceylanicum]|uniref:Reverse transcriptase domain-containing protein n=1 Tax=Ancylostoma ceylanicum TaxID=53326 RepID=A0A016UNJ0_9BILA|nr:hypothetical protein Y032_0033g2684 [Ancylostoma ceylanicum]EYC29705.1 hypothetical protein Y032_0006g3135 [Ancylostoma ceylanicum]
MDEDSRPLLTINTHRGLYRLNRLPFGVKFAPGILRQYIDALIAGLDGTAAYLDDIIVTGRTIDEHNTRLNAVFQRIHDYGFRDRLEKCAFLKLKSTTLVSSSTLKDAAPTRRRSKQSTRWHIQRASASYAPSSVLSTFMELSSRICTTSALRWTLSPRKMLSTRGHRSANLLSIASRQRSNRISS